MPLVYSYPAATAAALQLQAARLAKATAAQQALVESPTVFGYRRGGIKWGGMCGWGGGGSPLCCALSFTAPLGAARVVSAEGGRDVC